MSRDFITHSIISFYSWRNEKLEPVFSSSEIAILDSVAKHICCYSGKVLEKFTHSEAPWLSARADLSDSK